MTERRFVVLGDVVDSRNVSNRDSLRENLEQTLSEINNEYESGIRAPFRFLKGVDELGAVLSDISILYEAIKRIYVETRPVKIRFAGALGEVDVGADAEDIAEMDGPVFHRADRLLSELTDEGRLFRLDTSDDFADVLLGNHVNLNLMFMDSWTPKEMEIVTRYEKRKNQAEVAAELDVSQQRVSNALRETDWKVFHRMELELNDALEIHESLLKHDYSI